MYSERRYLEPPELSLKLTAHTANLSNPFKRADGISHRVTKSLMVNLAELLRCSVDTRETSKSSTIFATLRSVWQNGQIHSKRPLTACLEFA